MGLEISFAICLRNGSRSLCFFNAVNSVPAKLIAPETGVYSPQMILLQLTFLIPTLLPVQIPPPHGYLKKRYLPHLGKFLFFLRKAGLVVKRMLMFFNSTRGITGAVSYSRALPSQCSVISISVFFSATSSIYVTCGKRISLISGLVRRRLNFEYRGGQDYQESFLSLRAPLNVHDTSQQLYP